MVCTGFGCAWGLWRPLPAATAVSSFAYLGNSTLIVGSSVSGKLWITHNFGVTWFQTSQIGTATSVQSLLSLGNGTCLCGTGPFGCVYATHDYGDSWHLHQALGSETKVYSLFKSSTGTIFAGTDPHSQVWRSVDGGDTWTFSVALASTLWVTAFANSGTGRLLACSRANSYIAISDDDGITFPTANRVTRPWPVYYLINVTGSILLHFCGDNRRLYRSVNGGLAWSDLGVIFLTGTASFLGATDSGQFCFIGGSSNNIKRSGDYGVTWDTPTGFVTPYNLAGFVAFASAFAIVPGGTAGKMFCTPAVIAAPVSSFSGLPISGEAPLSVQFTDSSINTPVEWLWTFGDGETSTEQNPLHVYADAGIYDVGLTVTNPGGTDLLIKSDYITAGSPVPPPPYVTPIWTLQIGLL